MISPDSSHAFVSISTANYVALIDLNTLTLVGKIHAGPNPDGMWWSESKNCRRLGIGAIMDQIESARLQPLRENSTG